MVHLNPRANAGQSCAAVDSPGDPSLKETGSEKSRHMTPEAASTFPLSCPTNTGPPLMPASKGMVVLKHGVFKPLLP